MKTSYNFDRDLATLRILLSREAEFSAERRYVEVPKESVKSLTILLENWLRVHQGILDKDKRRDKRLAILSLITQSKVNTTYDLTLYQCSTISYFLRNGPEDINEAGSDPADYSLAERAIRFLEDCEART